MKKIELIEIDLENDLILPHPKQHELYGEEVLDEDFVESIKLQGVLQPPVVTYFKDVKDGFENHEYPKDAIVFISGHRRWKGSLKAGRVKLYCELKRYGNYFDSEVDHITYNKQRKKSKAQIAKELLAYKQKLDQIRKELKEKGVKALENFKSFDFQKHLKVDDEGNYYLPEGRELIEKDLGISETHQEQLNVIFSDDWLQKKVEKIHFSKLSAKKKREATETFSDLVEKGREEVDKKDGLSVNKVYNEIMRVWKDIDSVINPKPKEKAKKKKRKVTKEWLKPKDFITSKLDKNTPEGEKALETQADGIFYCREQEGEIIKLYSDKYKEIFIVSTDKLYDYLKEQGV